jgi:quinolinate synthase
MANVFLIVHNYQPPTVQQIARQTNGLIAGTTGICKAGKQMRGRKDVTAVVCSVAYMVEDFVTLSHGVKALTPVAWVRNGEYYMSRCPMIQEQNTSIGTLKPEVFEYIAKKYPDAIVGVNVNNCVAIKAREEVSFVFNASRGIAVLEKIAQSGEADTVVLVGNTNVSLYIKKTIQSKFSNLEIVLIPENLQCPPHLQIVAGDIMLTWEDAVRQHGKENVGVVAHAENDPYLLDWLPKIAGRVSGSGGMYRIVKDSEKPVFIVATVEGLPERIRSEIPNKTVISPRVLCPNMEFVGRENGWWVKNALKIAKNDGEVAGRLIVKDTNYPYYEFEYVGGGRVIEKSNDNLILGPCEVIVEQTFIDSAVKSLEVLLK